MPLPDRLKLLDGPYVALPQSVGARAFCLYRDCDVVVTAWTDAPIPWPRCRALHQRGGSGLLATEELVRAIRTESAAAVKFWWGVGTSAIWSWRKAFGVDRRSNPGTLRLIVAASMKGADATRDVPLPMEAVEVRRRKAIALNLGRHLLAGYHGPKWTKRQLVLLGSAADEEIASRIGRTSEAVRLMRTRLRIPTFEDRRKK